MHDCFSFLPFHGAYRKNPADTISDGWQSHTVKMSVYVCVAATVRTPHK